MKRIFALILVCLLAVSVFAGCGGDGGKTDGKANGSLVESSLQSGTLAISFPLNSDKIAQYKIVLPKVNLSYVVVRKVEKLVDCIKAKMGKNLEVVRDDTAATPFEIVIGNCQREGVITDLSYESFDIRLADNKAFINGGRGYSLAYAIDLLIKDINLDGVLNCDAQSGKYENTLDYTLVWNDEFDGEYNRAFWAPISRVDAKDTWYGLDFCRSNTADNLFIKDGMLYHSASFDAESFYGTYTSTANSLLFTYGIIEASCSLADGDGLWHCVRLTDSGKSGNDVLDFDVMECWSGAQYCFNAIHETVGGVVFGDAMSDNNRHTYITTNGFYKNDDALFHSEIKHNRDADRLLSKNLHVYSMLWDEENVSFYFDGNLTMNYNYVGSENEALYDNPHYIVLSMAVGTNKANLPDETPNSDPKLDRVKKPDLSASYWNDGSNNFMIDYIELYQKNGSYLDIK